MYWWKCSIDMSLMRMNPTLSYTIHIYNQGLSRITEIKDYIWKKTYEIANAFSSHIFFNSRWPYQWKALTVIGLRIRSTPLSLGLWSMLLTLGDVSWNGLFAVLLRFIWFSIDRKGLINKAAFCFSCGLKHASLLPLCLWQSGNEATRSCFSSSFSTGEPLGSYNQSPIRYIYIL